MNEQFDLERKKMVKNQLEARGINDQKILEAFEQIPRHRFVPSDITEQAYGDRPLYIGSGQTISQPYIVALMISLLELEGEEKVLEVGTGSGYQTAILASLAKKVYTIERKPELLAKAKNTLKDLGFTNIFFKEGDGTVGWKRHSPYDRIIGSGGVPKPPSSLVHQLADSGKLVIPTGSKSTQILTSVTKNRDEVNISKETACSFVPLIGKEGWESR